jgi:hypothetical protein
MCSHQKVGNAIRHWKYVVAAAAPKRAFEQFPGIAPDRIGNFETIPAERATDDL